MHVDSATDFVFQSTNAADSIAERALGLPRDDVPGKGLPYGEFLRGINQR